MQQSAALSAFAAGLALMMVSLAVNLIPTLKSGSAQARTKALIRAGIINALIIAGVIVYVVRHQ